MAGSRPDPHDTAYLRGDRVWVCGQPRTVTLCWGNTARGYRVTIHQPVYGLSEWAAWECRPYPPDSNPAATAEL